MTDLSDYKKIGVVFKNKWMFNEHYIFIYLSQTRWSMQHCPHTRKRLSFPTLKTFNMT